MCCVFLCLIYVYNDKKNFGESYIDEETGEEVHFYDDENTEAYLKLAVLFTFSALVTTISYKKFPFAAFVASVLPVWHCFKSLKTVGDMASFSTVGANRVFSSNDLLNRRPMIFVFFAVLNLCAAVAFMVVAYRHQKGLGDDGYCDFDEELPEVVDPEYIDEDKDEEIDFTKIV